MENRGHIIRSHLLPYDDVMYEMMNLLYGNFDECLALLKELNILRA